MWEREGQGGTPLCLLPVPTLPSTAAPRHLQLCREAELGDQELRPAADPVSQPQCGGSRSPSVLWPQDSVGGAQLPFQGSSWALLWVGWGAGVRGCRAHLLSQTGPWEPDLLRVDCGSPAPNTHPPRGSCGPCPDFALPQRPAAQPGPPLPSGAAWGTGQQGAWALEGATAGWGRQARPRRWKGQRSDLRARLGGRAGPGSGAALACGHQAAGRHRASFFY